MTERVMGVSRPVGQSVTCKTRARWLGYTMTETNRQGRGVSKSVGQSVGYLLDNG